jgi:type II secretory pathway pseudopilin PulG
MIHAKHSKKGFSLIELVIYLGLVSVLLLVLTETFSLIIQARLDAQSTSSVEENANYILAKLSYDFNRASAINSPSSYGVATSSAQFVIGGVNYTYSLNNGTLQLVNDSGTNTLNSITTTISNLQFIKIGTNNINTYKINFTVTSLAQSTSGKKEVKDYEVVLATK